jgi:salicylate hydroxylase
MNAPIVVAGAGIGGLTAALALAHNGRRALVLEQAPVITEVGAGLQIAPNAGRILARLGLDAALAAVALEPQAVNIRRGRDGDRLARLDLTVARARWGAPFRVFHRADLQQALLQAARAHPLIEVREDARVARFTPQENGVEIETQGAGDVMRLSAAGLVGADGGRSTVRAQLLPQEADAPVYSGASAWRALVPTERAPEALRAIESHLWLLPGAHVVHYPLRDGAIINVVVILEETTPDRTLTTRNGGDMAGDLARAGAAPLLCALIGGAESYRYWPLFARPPLTRWSHGAVTLLGDAAHPMVPFLAQGAAQAIEDADFAAYERARRMRAAAVVRASVRQGQIDHLHGPLATARDLAIRTLGGALLLKRNAWLYRDADASG